MTDSVDHRGSVSDSGAEPDTFEVSVEWRDRVVVLTIHGTVDMATAPQLSESIENALENRPTAIVVDLGHVRFFASAGMTVLVTAHETVSSSARFAVVAAGPTTARPLKLVGVDKVVTIYPDITSALDDLAR